MSSAPSSASHTDLTANKHLVSSFIDALSAHRLDEAFAMLRPDAEVWVLTARQSFSRDQYAGMYKELSATRFVDGIEMAATGPMTAEGDRVSVQGESHGEMTNGKIYNNLYHFLFEIEDGQIRKLWEYADTHHSMMTLRAPD